MKFFDNLKIKQKLTVSFMLVILLTIFMAGYSLVQQFSTVRQLEELALNEVTPMRNVVEIYNSFQRVRFDAVKAVAFSGGKTSMEDRKANEEITMAELQHLNEQLDQLVAYIEADDKVVMDAEGIRTIQGRLNNDYVPYVEEVLKHATKGQYDDAIGDLAGAVPIAKTVEEPIARQLESQIATLEEDLAHIQSKLNSVMIVTIIIIAFVIILSILISQYVASIIAKKINSIATSLNKVADGDFSDSEIFNSRDELGQLSRDLASCVDTIHNMVMDTKELGRKQSEGNINARLDVNAYKGEYKEMMVAINASFDDLLVDISDLMDVLRSYTAGDFSVNLRTLKGEKISVNQCVDQLKANLQDINTQINGVVNQASAGNVRYRADASKFGGDWGKILDGLNALLDTICTPFDEVGYVLSELSKGNLKARVMGNYQGEYDAMKTTINLSMSTISGYIGTIDNVLEEINNNNLTTNINEDFIGDFNNLKLAINNIIEKLNEVFKEFLVGADEVAIGAQQISNSSISLADGASEQVQSLQSLTRGVQKVSESSSHNADSAARANKISEQSKQNAITGDEQMKQMLVSMDEISQSSNEISNIIKVIEDIAFQTNVLALNAAVEAARAGAHGKGFAVVADEVRTLAARSSQAAKETTELIQTSISRVAYGSELAKTTAHALDEIVNNVTDVANIIEEISVSSKEQAAQVDQINDEIRIVENVVLKTSAASEEGVSTAEELSSQSTVLRDLIGTFKLKN